MAEVRIGTSGWDYESWRGEFYPDGLAKRRHLEYLGRQMPSVELNGSFYSLQRPARYEGWRDETPDDFLFAVKGSRFITHMKRLRDVETPLANFFASGVLALRHKLGPFLWQLPERQKYDPDRLEAFFDLLPRTTGAAADLAKGHDDKLKDDPYTEVDEDRPLRHALEVRHPSFETMECADLLRDHDVALAVSDSAGEWPLIEYVTGDFVYVRLHGETELYAGGYSRKPLRGWADKIDSWRKSGHDVYVYFDNDVEAHAPRDAQALAELVSGR